MNIPEKKLHTWPRINFLVSHHFMRHNDYYRELALALAKYSNFMVDSGAFSAVMAIKKKQSATDIHEYIDFCKRYYHNNAWQYVSLDVIGNKVRTQNNLDMMFDAGLKPMPVFVVGENYELALRLAEDYNNRICVAGGVKSGDNYIYKRYQNVWKYSNQKALIHGLGFLRWPDVFQLPIATGDSSTSSSGARFGHITYYSKTKGLVRDQWRSLLDRKNRKKERQQNIIAFMKKCGVSVEDMLDPELYRTSLGAPSLFELYATLQYMKHSSEQNFGMFSAFSASGWVLSFLSVLDASNETYFDFKHARELLFELRVKNKTEPEKVIEKACAIMKSKTDWQNTDLLDDNKQQKIMQKKFAAINLR